MSIDRYLRVSQVTAYVGLSRASIYAMEKSGTFPRKIALGARAVAWLESDIKKWMEEQKSTVKTGREAKPGRPRLAKVANPSTNTPSSGPVADSENEQRSPEPRAIRVSEISTTERDDDLERGNPKPITVPKLGEAGIPPQSQKSADRPLRRSGPRVDLLKPLLSVASKQRLVR